MEQIGLEAILEDKNFQEGLKRFNDGTNQMVHQSDSSASAMSRIGSVASGALTVGLAIGVASIAAFAAAGKQGLATTLAWGEQLDKLGDQFGMNAKQADVWATAMERMGVPVEEGAQQLNYFTKQMDDVKKAGEGNKTVVTDNSKKIASLKTQLEGANTQLERAKIKFKEAKKPTQEMQWAVDDAQKKVNKLNTELKATPLSTSKIKEAAAQLTPFQKALDKLGVSAFDAQGKTKSFDAIMPEIMAKFKAMPAGVEASALAMDLFGARGGSKFLDFLRDGNEALALATVRIDQFGGMTDQQVAAVEQFGRATKDTEDLLRRMWLQIGNNLLPIARDFIDYVNKNVLPALIQFAKDVMPKVNQALDWMRGFVKDVFDAFKTGDWSKVQRDFSDILTKIGDELRKAWPGIQQQLLTWAKQFWDWMTNPTNGVISQVVGNVAKLIASLASELQKKWPNIQQQLIAWKDQFWGWLTNPETGAIANAGRELSSLVEILKLRLNEAWPEIQTQLDKWRDLFWNWLTNPETGAISQTGTKLNEWSKEFERWSKDPETQKQFHDIGASIGAGIVEGVKSFLGTPESRTSTGNALIDFLQFSAVTNARTNQGVKDIAGAFFGGFLSSITSNMNIPTNWEQLGGALVEFFRQGLANMAKSSALGGYISIAMTTVGKLMEVDLSLALSNILDTMKEPFILAWNWIKTQSWGGLGAFVSNAIKSGIDSVTGILGALTGPLAQAWNWAATLDWPELGRNIARRLEQGIREAANGIRNALSEPFNNAIGEIKRLLGIASPSRVMMEIGKQMAAGLTQGFGAPQIEYGLPSMGSTPLYGGGGGNTSYSNSSTTNNYFTLNNYSAAPSSNVAGDFRIMQSLAG